jgi:hypothetical protein
MDKRFDAFLESQEILLTEEGVGAFGTKIDAGFRYEPETGRDLTYEEDNVVIHHPNENS